MAMRSLARAWPRLVDGVDDLSYEPPSILLSLDVLLVGISSGIETRLLDAVEILLLGFGDGEPVG
jgi:hypothetical protein